MFNFKKAFGLLAIAAAVAFSPVTRAATFAGTGTDISTNLCYYVTSANEGGVPRVNYINATSDKAGSVIQFYRAAAPVLITTAGAATNTVTAVGTGNFSGSDVVIFRDVSADTYQRLTVSAVTATNITFNENLSVASAVGDALYKATTAGSIPVGNATKEINAAGGGIYNGAEGRPLLVEIDGTSACQINVISGVFER